MRFDDFELDEPNARLSRAGQILHLPPKALAVLCTLSRSPGQLIRKNDLLDAVWGHRFVSDSVLKTAISQLRTALGDDSANPRYIETVARLGYRFIGKPGGGGAGALTQLAGDDPLPAAATLPMIGRAALVSRLSDAWRSAGSGKPCLFWIAGDAGVGKTTLIEHFVQAAGAPLAVFGQCVEQYGAGEPYLPLLQALGALARSHGELPDMLRTTAPSWLLQMPWLATETERANLGRELAGSGPERMLRELLQLLELFTRDRPLLLVTEDLHWSDHATLRLMDLFARWHGPLRVLWIASFRLTQVIAEGHPLQALRHELKLHRRCEEVLLDTFSEREVAAYVSGRLPEIPVAESFVRRLHRHTDGLPLFVASVMDAMLLSGESRAPIEDWLRGAAMETLPVPEDLTGTLDRQIDRLAPELRRLLEAASVCGTEFRARTLAAILDLDPLAATENLDALARRQIWLRHEAVLDLADGTLDAYYAFRHAIYKHAFYRQLGPAQRVQLHRRVARALLAEPAAGTPAAGAPVAPAELAYHLEQGRDFAGALKHYVKAAELALGQFAPKEAEELARHALQLLPLLAEGLERRELELVLLAHLGTACTQLYGMSSAEACDLLERAREICEQLPQTPQRALLLTSFGWTLYVRGQYPRAQSLGERVHALAVAHANPVLLVSACNLLGMVGATRGDFRQAQVWLEQGITTVTHLGEQLPAAPFVIDPAVTLRSVLAVNLVSLGCSDQARDQAALAITAAERSGHAMARSFSRRCAAMVEIRLREAQRARVHTEELGRIIAATGLVQPVAPHLWMHGWVEACAGNVQTGLQQIQCGYDLHVRMGMMAGRVEALICLIEALLLQGDRAAAAARLAEARELSENLGELAYLPDLRALDERLAAPPDRITAL